VPLPTSPSSPARPYHRLLLTAHLPPPPPDHIAKRASPLSPSVGSDPDSSSSLTLRLGVVLPPHRHADARVRGDVRLGAGLAHCLQHALGSHQRRPEPPRVARGRLRHRRKPRPAPGVLFNRLQPALLLLIDVDVCLLGVAPHCLRCRARAALLTGELPPISLFVLLFLIDLALLPCPCRHSVWIILVMKVNCWVLV
jgi:hypothetical protein